MLGETRHLYPLATSHRRLVGADARREPVICRHGVDLGLAPLDDAGNKLVYQVVIRPAAPTPLHEGGVRRALVAHASPEALDLCGQAMARIRHRHALRRRAAAAFLRPVQGLSGREHRRFPCTCPHSKAALSP